MHTVQVFKRGYSRFFQSGACSHEIWLGDKGIGIVLSFLRIRLLCFMFFVLRCTGKYCPANGHILPVKRNERQQEKIYWF